MKKCKKLFVLVLMFTLLTSTYLKPVNAATYQICGYQWPSSSISYYYDNYNSSRFKSFLNDAASVWNSSGVSKARLSYNYGSGVYCTEGYYPNAQDDGWSYIYWDSKGIITSASILINTAATTTWNNDYALKSVFVHEFGHILSLDENWPLECVMNTYTWGYLSRYGTFGIYKPQPVDVAAINTVYY